MAPPVDTGLMQTWITDRIPAKDIPPQQGSAGDFDRWITDRITFKWMVGADDGGISRIRRMPRGLV